MWIVTAVGAQNPIRAAADSFDEAAEQLLSAVSWFEEAPNRFRFEGFAEDEHAAKAAVAAVEALGLGLSVHAEPLPDADWVAMSLDGLPPVRAGRFVVAGAHAIRQVRGGRKRIWIEASEAFGTGHHGTTKGCLLALEDLLRKRPAPRHVLDVGAGSGVLAIAAARIGARALAVEIDPRAAAIMGENVKNNAVGARVRWCAADGAKTASGPARYDLIFANILMRPLIRLSPVLTRALAPQGRLVLSGLVTRQEPLVRLAYQNRGLVLDARYRRETWSTLVWRKP